MESWKEISNKKKNYKREGIESEYPLTGNSKYKPAKLFTVETMYDKLFYGKWSGYSSYPTLEEAIFQVREYRRKEPYGINDWLHYRIINKKTKEVVWEEE